MARQAGRARRRPRGRPPDGDDPPARGVSFIPSASTIVSRIASLVAFRICPVCRRPSGFREATDALCAWCTARLYPNGNPGVAVPLPGERGRILAESPFLHAGSARDLVLGLKYRGRRGLGRIAAGLMAEAGMGAAVAGCILVPMPLCPSRIRQRGYNQASEIAVPLARLLGAGISDCLSRVDRPPQAGLQAVERRENVRGTFRRGREPVPEGAPLVLVDDVVTTGSTMEEAARFLTGAGGDVAGALTLTYRPEFRVDIID